MIIALHYLVYSTSGILDKPPLSIPLLRGYRGMSCTSYMHEHHIPEWRVQFDCVVFKLPAHLQNIGPVVVGDYERLILQ